MLGGLLYHFGRASLVDAPTILLAGAAFVALCKTLSCPTSSSPEAFYLSCSLGSSLVCLTAAGTLDPSSARDQMNFGGSFSVPVKCMHPDGLNTARHHHLGATVGKPFVTLVGGVASARQIVLPILMLCPLTISLP